MPLLSKYLLQISFLEEDTDGKTILTAIQQIISNIVYIR